MEEQEKSLVVVTIYENGGVALHSIVNLKPAPEFREVIFESDGWPVLMSHKNGKLIIKRLVNCAEKRDEESGELVYYIGGKEEELAVLKMKP